MKIKVRGYLTFREVLEQISLQEFEGVDVSIIDLLNRLSIQLGEEFSRLIFESDSRDINSSIAILINGIHYSHLPKRLDTRLKDGDEVSIFPPIAGG
ncbi:MAG: MoaD family protein [Anaerolineales bacterium]|nr:MoaD family protein [Anaerolineales bacterium]